MNKNTNSDGKRDSQKALDVEHTLNHLRHCSLDRSTPAPCPYWSDYPWGIAAIQT